MMSQFSYQLLQKNWGALSCRFLSVFLMCFPQLSHCQTGLLVTERNEALKEAGGGQIDVKI